MEAALKEGYRHINSAYLYGKGKEIGGALQKCFKDGIVKREDLFITSKLGYVVCLGIPARYLASIPRPGLFNFLRLMVRAVTLMVHYQTIGLDTNLQKMCYPVARRPSSI